MTTDRQHMQEAVRLMTVARKHLEPCCGDDHAAAAVDDLTDAIEQAGWALALLDEDQTG